MHFSELIGNDVNVHRKEERVLVNRDFKRKTKCCDLGRKMAKIGETCEYATTMANIHPNFAHFHMMKTSVWTSHSQPIKARRLQKCRKYKAYFKKCCLYESSQIEKDLQHLRKRVRLMKKRFFQKKLNIKTRRNFKRKSKAKPLKIDVSPRGLWLSIMFGDQKNTTTTRLLVNKTISNKLKVIQTTNCCQKKFY